MVNTISCTMCDQNTPRGPSLTTGATVRHGVGGTTKRLNKTCRCHTRTPTKNEHLAPSQSVLQNTNLQCSTFELERKWYMAPNYCTMPCLSNTYHNAMAQRIVSYTVVRHGSYVRAAASKDCKKHKMEECLGHCMARRTFSPK